jgi:hypothetical protein
MIVEAHVHRRASTIGAFSPLRLIEDSEAEAEQRAAAEKARRRRKLRAVPQRIRRLTIESTSETGRAAKTDVIADRNHVLDGEKEVSVRSSTKNEHSTGTTTNNAHRTLSNAITFMTIGSRSFKNDTFLIQEARPLQANEAISIGPKES